MLGLQTWKGLGGKMGREGARYQRFQSWSVFVVVCFVVLGIVPELRTKHSTT
jgi:hypothetical protein